MMAAGTAAARGCRVTLFDPNGRGGRKLALTGKGRCNLTNDSAVEECLAHTLRNPRFLYSAFSAFPPAAAAAFFEALGVPLQTERGRRVFPVSGRAGDVVAALTDWLAGLGVSVRAGRVTAVLRDGSGAVRGAGTTAGAVACDALVIATGGLSYPKTGSTGDGYRLAASVGHTICPTAPSLVPLHSPALYCGEMAGLSLRHVALTAYDGGGQKRYAGFGEMLFTHTGVSGPLVLSASAHLRDRAAGGRLSIDLKPALSGAALDRRLLRDFEAHANRDFQNALGDLLHKKMIPVIINLSGIRPEKKVHSVSRAERAALLALCKDFPVPVSGPAPVDEAVVTAGGVDVRELRPATMESRLCAGLHFAGEVIDVDAYTGGFNLQIAWSTGRAAGNGAAEGAKRRPEA
jgi:predicted Rossmann fold flavoprotein